MDTKKLVSIFLILSSVSGALSFVASHVTAPPPSAATGKPLAEQGNTEATASPEIAKNAFVEQLPEAAAKKIILPGGNGLPPIIETENITEDIAQNLTRTILEAGKGAAAEGNAIAPPTDAQITQDIASRIFSPEALGRVKLPDLSGAIPDKDIAITADATPEGLARYLEAVRAILARTILSNNFERLIATSAPSQDILSPLQETHAQALRDLIALPAPVALKDLHKSLVALVKNRKTFADIPTAYPDDPAKTLLLLDGTADKIQPTIARDAKRLAEEIARANRALGGMPSKSDLARLAELIIPTAHAQAVPITTALDVNTITINGSTYSTLAQLIWKFTRDILLQSLKRMLINLIEQQVVGWINTGRFGEPYFVTDWGNLIGITYDAASNSTINQIAKFLCGGMNTYIRAALFPGPSYYRQNMCTLNQILNNVQAMQDFYANFRFGGFPAYYTALDHNFFIYSIQVSDAAANAGLAASQNNLFEAIAGNGFLGLKRCPGSTNDNPIKPDPDGLCPPTTYAGARTRPTIVTPGTAAGQSLAHTLGAGQNTIVNANDITELVAVIVDSALNKLIQMGVAGLQGVSYGSNTWTGTASACGSLSGQAQATCLETARKANVTATDPRLTRVSRPTIISATSTSVAPPLPPPPPVPVQCAPTSQTAAIDPLLRYAQVNVSVARDLASGFFTGRSPYTWSAPGASGRTSQGPSSETNFSTAYTISSTIPYEITVWDTTEASSTCTVTVQ